MESMVYRHHMANERQMTRDGDGPPSDRKEPERLVGHEEHTTLTPAVFYPTVRDEDLTMWKSWLPTVHVFPCTVASGSSRIAKQLELLHAPREVFEEFEWAQKMELFDTYEVRTPERPDQRDPLLLGRQGSVYYRIALWAESLRPLEEIADLVQQSLTIKRRTATWRAWVTLSGMAVGLGLGCWMGYTQPQESSISLALFMMLLVGGMSFVPFGVHSPERRQQDFLDQYRN
jgi:hypothetical protein